MGKIINRARERQAAKQHRDERQRADEAIDGILRAYAALHAAPPPWFIGLFVVAMVGIFGYATYAVFWG